MKHIVSDLGGVIINLYWIELVEKIIGEKYKLDELVLMWNNGKSTYEYETGKQRDFDEFIYQFSTEFHVDLPHNKIKRYFMDIVGEPKEGFFEIFKSLKKKGYILSVLSNTNPAHVNFLTEKYDLFKIFDHKFFSYEIGYLKPRKEAYKYVIKKLKTIPSDIFFFDDANINVKAAISVGLKAFQVTSPQEIYEEMSKLN